VPPFFFHTCDNIRIMKYILGYFALSLAQSLPTRYLIVSVPSEGKIVSHSLGNFEAELHPGSKPKDVQVLIGALNFPMGIAYSKQDSTLYVSDHGDQAIYRFPITFSSSNGPLVGAKETVMQNVETRWLAIHGNYLFFTDEATNRILRLAKGDTWAETVYSAEDSGNPSLVSSPGGIYSDEYYLYWTNKLQGTKHGVVVKGLEHPPKVEKSKSASLLAKNVNKAFGVCGSDSVIYFTNEVGIIYGVKKDGSDQKEISSELSKTRGCAFSDGTVYVADQATGVYAFAGNRSTLRPTGKLQLVQSIVGATGIVVLSSGSSHVTPLVSTIALMLLFLV